MILLIAVRNLKRNLFRTLMTMAGVAIAVVTFVFLQSINNSIRGSGEQTGEARLYTTNRVSWFLPMPKKYAGLVKDNIPGVSAVTYTSYFQGRLPAEPNYIFLSLAVDTSTFLDVFNELVVSPEDKARWLGDRQGVLIGDILAKKLNLKVGDHIGLQGTLYRGDWNFAVAGIYTTSRRTWDRTSVFIHWDYLNDTVPQFQKDKINYVAVHMSDDSATVASRIETFFENRETRVRSFSQAEEAKQIASMFVSMVRALNAISVAILGILALVIGNTIATSVRERTKEFGMMRAVGFSEQMIGTFIVMESVVLALAGGCIGLAIAFPLVEAGIGKFLTETANEIFPSFVIPMSAVALALALSCALGIVGAVLPTIRVARMSVTDALRRVD